MLQNGIKVEPDLHTLLLQLILMITHVIINEKIELLLGVGTLPLIPRLFNRSMLFPHSGGHFWELPAVELEYPAGLDRYKWFAKCLLDGAVFTGLLEFVPVLLSAPVTMVKPWAK